MRATDIMKRAFGTALSSRRLWLFGFFVAAASSSSGGGDHGGGGGGGLAGELPLWLVPVLVAAGLAALAGLAMHVVSEAALIDGVGGGAPSRYRIRQGLAAGRRSFLRVLGLKALRIAVSALSVGVAGAPAALGAAGLVPLWLGVALSLPLALVAVPWLLTVYFLYEYALRFAVLDGLSVRAALKLAEGHLRGRVGESLRLLGVSLVGQLAGGAAFALAAIPCAGVGLLVWLAAGPVAAGVVGGLLLAPLGACILGALGTYRSSVWTLAFVDADGASA